jgi:chromosome segregation ATPase
MSRTTEEARTLEAVQLEAGQLQAARTAIHARLSELEESIAAASLSEEENREKSLRHGYPAKPDRKLRTLKDEAIDLREQLETTARIQARLDLEMLEHAVEDCGRRRAVGVKKASRIEEEYRAVEERLNAARNEIHGTQEEERGLNEQIYRARTRLADLDPRHEEREREEYEGKLAEVQAGILRQWAEHVETNSAAHPPHHIPSA